MFSLGFLILACLCAFPPATLVVVGQEINSVDFDFTSKETDVLLDPDRYLNITPPEPPTEFPTFITGPVKPLHGKLFNDTFNLILQKGLFFNTAAARSGSGPADFKMPEELKSLVDMRLGENGVSHEELISLLERVIQYSPHVSHPFYLDRRGGGLDPYAVVGDMLATTMSSVLLTYYTAPVFTLMEIEITKKIRELIGYPDGVGDGITSPGPSFANIMALQMALHYKNKQIKVSGLVGAESPKFVIFISEHADDSFAKAAILEGLGLEALIKIPVDPNGRMDVSQLKSAIEKANGDGKIPLMIVATIGTPSLGAIDPVNEIADVAASTNNGNGTWLHIDGTMTGPLLISTAHKDMLAGVNRSDSFTWGSSFLFGVPRTSSFIVTKHEKLLSSTFGYEAQYVFAKSILYNQSYDLGDNTIQTCRRPDVLKTWFLWKSKGWKGLQAHIEYVYGLKQEFIALLRNASVETPKKFVVLAPNMDSPIVSFNYMPKELRNMELTDETNQKLSEFTEKLKSALLKQAKIKVSMSSFPNKPKFLTMALTNSALTKADLTFIMQQIEYHGDRIWGDANANANAMEPRSTGNQPPPPPLPSTYPTFTSAPIEALHKTFFVYAFQRLITHGLFFQRKRKDPAKRFRTPEALAKIIDLKFESEPITENNLLAELDKVIDFSAHHSHPLWVYQLFTGLNPYSIIADYMVSILNTGMQTYASSPIFTLAEVEILHNIRRMIGYPNDGEGDGVINPGGTLSNIMGITLARHKKAPQIKLKGNSAAGEGAGGKKLVYYMNIDGHYSFNKGAFLLGLGIENCVLVKADEHGRMSMPALREQIQKTLADGNIPFMVAATAGTTVLGAIDPLHEIGQICKEFGMWFHVDSIFGGSVMFSETHKKKLAGIELSDSLGFNPHKMFSAAMTISVFVTRHPGIIQEALGTGSVTAQAGKEAAAIMGPAQYDRGDNHLLLDRRANGFKFWLLWKAQGSKGMGQHIDYVMENTKYAQSLLNARNDTFHMVLPEFDLTNVCFIYVPLQYRLLEKGTEVYKKSLDPIASQLQMRLVQNGIVDVVVQKTESMDTPTFIKLVLMSSTTTKADIAYILNQLDFWGRDL